MEYLLPPPRPCQQGQWQLLLPSPGIILYLPFDKSKENQVAFESDVQGKVNFQTHCHRGRLFSGEVTDLVSWPAHSYFIAEATCMHDLLPCKIVFIPSASRELCAILNRTWIHMSTHRQKCEAVPSAHQEYVTRESRKNGEMHQACKWAVSYL